MHGPWDDYKDSTSSDNSGPWNDYASPKESSSPKPSTKSKMAAALSRAFTQSANDAEGKYLPRHPQDDARDMVQGAAEAIPSLVQNMARLQDKATPDFIKKNPVLHSLLSQALGLPQPMNNKGLEYTDISKLTAPIGSGAHDLSSELFRGAGQAAIPLAGEDDMASEIAKAIPSAGKGVASILGRLISGGAIGLSTPSNNLKETAENVGAGAATNATVPAAIENIAKIIEKLRPSKLLRGTLSPKELEENLEQTKGTKTGLGPIIGNKYLKDKLEVTAPQYRGTGANNTMQETAQQLTQKGQGLMQEMLGESQPSEVPVELKTGLQKAEKQVNATSKKKANALNEAADAAGLKASDNNLAAKATDIISRINRSSKLSRKIPQHIKDDLDFYSKSKEEDSLADADIFKGTLNDEAQELFKSGKKYQAGIYGRLRDAKQKDIDEALDSSKDENIGNLRNEYREHFKKEKVPFEDKDVTKFTRKGGDPDLFLKTFLKTGNTDRPVQLEKVMSKLPKDKKDLMAYAHYSGALDKNGKFNPQKFATLHNKLSQNQKSVLFAHNRPLEKKLDQYAGLVGKNTKALQTMLSPENGAKLAVFAPTATAVSGAGIGASIAGIPGAAAGAVIGAVGPSVAGKIATKLLTSEKRRTNLIKAMLENKAKFKGGGRKTKVLQAFAHGATNSAGGQ